ncbi:SdrD B-like domain-containing protein [Buchananella felis]|uniref:SdrD B-like domain-containing protein n=1 Tax=Buchananella felis TaxID=3231492 RepID=UPI003526F491
MLGGVGLTQLATGAADAAVHPGIKVTDMVIKRKHATQNTGVDGAVRHNELVYGTWAWSSEGAQPRPVEGDSFSFTISDAYRLQDTARFALEVSPGVSVGNCDISNYRTVTCTFDGGLSAQYAVGQSFVKGTGWFVARTTKAVKETTTDFDLNGVTQAVANPGGVAIAPLVYSFNPQDLSKASDGVNSSSRSISWNIVWTGDKLRDRFPNGEIPNPLVFTDTLGPGHKYHDHVSLAALKTPDRPSIDQRRIYWRSKPSGFPMVTPEDNIGMFRVEVEYNEDRTQATYKIYKEAGEWSKDVLYLLSYNTAPTSANGVINPGLKYQNSVTLTGTNFSRTVSTRYVQSAGATANLRPSYGTFKLTKTLGGAASGEVVPGTQVKFKVGYTLPQGWNPSDNPEWVAPASNPFDFKVAIGQTGTYFPNAQPFPEGTQIRMEEDVTFAEPVLPGHIQWGEPTLTVERTSAAVATFTIEGGKVTEVGAENNAKKKASVSVGDFVWEDTDKDGRQGGDPAVDKPLNNVTLTLSRTDNQPVKKFDGTDAPLTTTTDSEGKYLFPDLALLPEGATYKVTVTPPAGYRPTQAGQGDRALDSSTGFALANPLPRDGDKDLSLDFGFVKDAPGIDIEKYDGTWNGVQFTGDKPNLTGGQPAVLPVGDRDSADQALLLRADQSQEVKFTVTNTGDTGLNNVVVSDRTGSGPALTDLKCHINNADVAAVAGANGLVVTAEAGWVLAPKASFQCTATMPALGTALAHDNTATVEATPVAGGDKLTDSDAWHAKRAAKVSVGDYVWFDVNKDGLQDDTDRPLDGVTVTLTGPDGGPVTDVNNYVVAPAITANGGKYLFENLPVLADGEKYTVTVTAPEGYIPTTAGANNGAGETDSSTATSASVKELKTDGASDLTLDFGFIKPSVSVGDYVWYDKNKDGLQDDTDVPLKDVTLTISRTDNKPVSKVDGTPVTTTTTNEQGKYLFADLELLPAGEKYVVTVTPPAGYVPTKANQGTDKAVDSSTTKETAVALTTNGASDLTLDFGFIKPSVSVGDYVWFDANKDGLQDASDVPLQGVTLALSRTDDQPAKKIDGTAVTTTTTNEQGKYLFADLEVLPQDVFYKVTVTDPANYQPTTAGAGSDRAKDSSTTVATAGALPNDGDKDLSLDFGFVKKPTGIDIEKYDGAWSGVVFDQAGNAELVDGQPKVLPAGDRDTEDVALVLSGLAAQPVKFTVTNTGKGELNNVKVSDTTIVGPALTDFKCRIDGADVVAVDGVVSAPAAWVFAPKASFECTATLAAMTDAAKHANTARVEATPVAGGDKLTDSDNWHAKRGKVSVGDYVWYDANKDGLQDASDVALEDVTLTLSRTDGKPAKKVDGSVVTTTTTDATGKYLFADLEILPAGAKYVVTVTNPRGFVPTTPGAGSDRAKDSSTGSETAVVLPNDGDKDLSLDFGFVKAKVSVGDYVWFDANKDGLQDDDEKGIKDVVLTISRTDGKPVKDADGNPVTTTTTDASGMYLFKDLEMLPAGEKYVVTVTDPAGYVPTKAEAGSDRAKDSSTGSATAQELTSDGAKDLTLDFGFFFPEVSVGDYVWYDVNKDGLQDATDVPLKDVTLTISRSDGKPVNNADHTARTELTTTTDEHGKYAFTGLEVLTGEVKYIVTVTAPFGYVPTKAGMNNGAGSDDSSTQTSASVADLSTDGANDPTLDFGFIKAKVSVGDYVWFDKNKDGLQDTGEPGIKDVTLTLTGPDGKSVTDVNGNPVGPVKTDEHGKYLFENLPVLPKDQSYTVTVSDPAGYLPTKAGTNNGQGANDSSTTTSVSLADLSTDGASDLTLDFGYYKPSVTVGDYVFEDLNDNGIQDNTDKPIAGVTLKITGPDGKDVTDVNGNPVGPVKTDENGKYLFDNLPVLKDNQSYTVTITPPAGYQPAKTGQGTRETDSSTDKATTIGLTKDGDKDLSLDFGFKKPTTKGGKGGKLAKTGTNALTLAPYALTLLAAGGTLLLLRRKKS